MSILTRKKPETYHEAKAQILKERGLDQPPQFPRGVLRSIPGWGQVWMTERGEREAFYAEFYDWVARRKNVEEYFSGDWVGDDD